MRPGAITTSLCRAVLLLRCIQTQGVATQASGACGGHGCDDGEAGLVNVHLLQTKLSRSRAGPLRSRETVTNLSSRTRPTEIITPIVWLHIEKTGSNFINILLGMKAFCPITPKAFVPDAAGLLHVDSASMDKGGDAFAEISTECPGAFNTLLSSYHLTAMGNQTTYMHDYLRHTVSMFRQPEQRLISGYANGLHSWSCEAKPDSVLDYAIGLQGCSVKMLTRVSKGLYVPVTADGCTTLKANRYELVCSNQTVPTEEETLLAVDRVKDLAFVGITEKWDLSMCLFHAMFGGQCRAADFYSDSKDKFDSDKIAMEKDFVTGLYVTDPLHGFTDEYDGKVYAEVLRVFKNRLQEYDVSPETCQPCFDEAEKEKLSQLKREAAWLLHVDVNLSS